MFRRPHSLLRLGLAIMGLISASVMASGVTPMDESLEYQVKGAYLFKFGSFVEWPSSAFPGANSPLTIGVLGDDPFGAVLDEIIKNRTVGSRPLVIHRFQRGEQPKEVHILFISRSERAQLESINESLKGVLTIGEFDTATPSVMINFVVSDNKVRFEVDLDQANRAGVKLSSKLLSVARAVKGKAQ